jgi:hypothetical protein
MRRETNPPRPAPFSIRLSASERQRLESAASGVAIGAYVKERLFSDGASQRTPRGHAPIKDHAALAQLLARLGASRIANNLNQLAYAANIGTLSADPETIRGLHDAYHDIRVIRDLLLQALGQRPPENSAVGKKVRRRSKPRPELREDRP